MSPRIAADHVSIYCLLKLTRESVRILSYFLPVKSPWLNPIEPKWAIVELARLLDAQEVTNRVCAYVGRSHESQLTITDKEA